MELKDDRYEADWRTEDFDLAGDQLYRIRVLLDVLQLGFADVLLIGCNPHRDDDDECHSGGHEENHSDDPSGPFEMENGKHLDIKVRIEEWAARFAGTHVP